MVLKEAAITGLGCVLPAAVGAKSLAHALFSPAPGDSSSPVRVETLAAEAKKKLPPLVRRRMSRLSSMVSLACREALESANLDVEAGRDSMGFVFGTGYGELDTTSRMFQAGLENNMSPTLFHNSVHNAPMGYAGIITGIRGVSLTVSDGHVSGESALIQAAGLIAAGVVPIVTAGAGDERYEFPLFQDPGQKSDPGEGSGFVVLETRGSMEARKAAPLAWLRGWSACGAWGDPADVDHRAAVTCACLEETLADIRGAGPESLGVFAHLVEGDRESGILLESLGRIFGRVPTLWSSRDLGGTYPASGASRIVSAVLSIEKQAFPGRARVCEGFGGKVEHVLVVGMDPEGDVASLVLSAA
jgi:3-oxoacyl-(acyl-carrier-protein) synthase